MLSGQTLTEKNETLTYAKQCHTTDVESLDSAVHVHFIKHVLQTMFYLMAAYLSSNYVKMKTINCLTKASTKI